MYKKQGERFNREVHLERTEWTQECNCIPGLHWEVSNTQFNLNQEKNGGDFLANLTAKFRPSYIKVIHAIVWRQSSSNSQFCCLLLGFNVRQAPQSWWSPMTPGLLPLTVQQCLWKGLFFLHSSCKLHVLVQMSFACAMYKSITIYCGGGVPRFRSHFYLLAAAW